METSGRYVETETERDPFTIVRHHFWEPVVIEEARGR